MTAQSPGVAGVVDDATAPGHLVEFYWNAPAGCPSSDEVVTAIEKLLGAPLEQPRSRRVSAIATVRQLDDGRWEMRLYTVTPEKTRSRVLVDESCKVLAEGTALVVAVAIDPDAVTALPPRHGHDETEEEHDDEPTQPSEQDAEQEAEPAKDPGPSLAHEHPSPAEDDARPPQVLTAADPRSPIGLGLAAAGGVGGGLLPGVGGGAKISAGLLLPRARVQAGATTWPVRTVDLREASGRVVLHQWALSLAGCGMPVTRIVELALCGGLEAGQVLARPSGLARPRRGAQPFLAGNFDTRLSWLVRPRWALFVEGTMVVPVVRAAFDVDGFGLAHRVGPVGGRGTVGIELRLDLRRVSPSGADRKPRR